MKKFLILAIACTTACLLHAQIPKSITLPKETVINPNPSAPEVPCNNFAGTFTLGQKGVNTRSNDLTLDTLFLCHNDSIFINHNGDFNLSGDPQPATPAGVSYAFYTCEPTVTGPTLQDITGSSLPPLPGDPCRLVSSNPLDLLVAQNSVDGDLWFFNSGFLQTTYNMGSPMLVHFAPVTIDVIATSGYEPAIQGGPPGPCVNVNTAAQFEVVYLNPIAAVGFTNPFNGNSCLGRFKIEGGYPEYELSAKYDLNIYLKSDPTVKALVNNSAQQIKHGTSIVFSVPQSGTYVIEALDGKSCPLAIEVNILACNDADNIKFTLPQAEAAPGQVVCLPITTGNFSNIQGFTTSISWDPALLQLAPGTFIQNINPDLLPEFDPTLPGSAEITQIGDGFLGLLYSGNGNATLGSSEVLMEVCFLVISQEDSICTPVTFTNQPSLVGAVTGAGAQLAFEAINGEVCIVYDTVAMDIDILTPNCNGTTNVEVRISGGDAPYELTWQLLTPMPGATPSIDNIMAGQVVTLPNLIPGLYQLIATPQNGIDVTNADTVQITILANTLGAALDLSMLPSCNGSTDGTVTAIVFQGSTQVPSPWTGFTFTWNPPLGGSTQGVLTNVSSGPYAVTVTQTSTGCTAVASGTLPNPPVLDNGMVTITPATCSGVDDGEVIYEVEGGTPTPLGQYNIEILFSENPNDPNATLLNTVVGDSWSSTNLFTGYYTINVTDANMCTYTDEIFVDAVRVVTLSEDMTQYRQPLCNGGTDGRIGVTVSIVPAPPGGPNFTFSWLPIGGIELGNLSAGVLDSIPAGTYTVTAVDDNGCSGELTLELFEPQPFTASVISSVNPTCPNPTGGAISASGFGGSGLPSSFTYLWSNMATTSTISGLVEGTYTVTATDANGCTATTSVTLALPAPPAITGITQVDVRCGGDGSLTVTAPTAVSYNWTSSNGPVPNPTSAAITGLEGGTYTVTVTDANGCTSSSTATLIGVEPLVLLDTTLNTPSCNGYLDGSIALGISGGTPGYTYNWDPANLNSPIILGLTAGLYTVTVTDSKQCTLVSEIELLEPPAIVALVTEPEVKTTCFGDCDGVATLQVSYLTGSNFNFIWDNGSTDSLRTDLCTGLNTVTITETSAAQCFLIYEVNVTSPPEITKDPTESSVKNVTCNGDADGSISLQATGGNGSPFTYLWQQGATTSTIQNLMPGDYVVTVTDNNGCTQEFTETVGQPAPVVVAIDNAATMLISCFGEDDGKLAVITTGGNIAPPGQTQYTYVWSDGVNQIGTTNPIDMLKAGNYTVTVSDYKMCTGTVTLLLSDPPKVSGSYQLGEPIKCFGEETTIMVSNIAGGQGAPYSYTIDFGVPLDPSFTSSITGGEHYITYIDKQNCEWTDTIPVPEPAQILVTFDPASIEIELGDSLLLTPIITGASGDMFVWDPADALTNPDTLYPTLYTFESVNLMLTITDEKGCTGKGTLPVEVDPNRNVYVPNIFIPGGNLNEFNNYFTPFIGVGVSNINYMRVFDRWGELMYERKNFYPDDLAVTAGWDGRFNGKFVEPGVYIYAIEVVFLDKKVLLYRGDVTVVR